MTSEALSHLRICDFTGQLAGAGSTRWLAAFGAQVIRIEDPVRQGRWDILRGSPPFKDERRGVELGSGFNNHNVEKLGITVNLRTERGRDLVRELVAISDAVTENFAAGVLDRLGRPSKNRRSTCPEIDAEGDTGRGSLVTDEAKHTDRQPALVGPGVGEGNQLQIEPWQCVFPG